jgi:hypothetical protein
VFINKMSCAPLTDISIHRVGIPFIEENAHILSDKLEPDDPKITVKEVIDWICICPYETHSVYISNYPNDTVIWSKENGFCMKSDGIFYEEMEKHRKGFAKPSEIIGIYVLMAKIN